MQQNTVCFVSYLDQDNLGVGYLASSLLQTGRYDIMLIDIKESIPVIITNIADARPLIIGFSIVFQAQLRTYQNLMMILRENGIGCHFTAGGHYPSLCYEELMRLIPELDSVVLFEGEHTIVELAEAIQNNTEWRGVDGIAYRNNGAIKRNPLRSQENDLDRFPLPVRRAIRPVILGQKVINLLAGRGCYYNCSFCSIQRFYSQSSGKVKRIRRPEFVAREIQLHYEQEGCTIFLFQDDDFPIVDANRYAWIEEFCRQLRERRLANNIMWKISCRANEIDEKLFFMLMEHGLGMVYLGIESGRAEGLESMNKRITPEDNITAAKNLKKLHLPYEFGFMIFEPYTTFDSIRKDVDFLFRLCGDGSASIGLAKLLALSGTEIKESLRLQNRLCGSPPYEDYNFLDPLLDEYYAQLSKIFYAWMHEENGFFIYSRWVHMQIEAFRRFYRQNNEVTNVNDELQQIVSAANQYLLNTVISIAELIKLGSHAYDALAEVESITAAKHNECCAQLAALAMRVEVLAGVR